MMYAYTNDEHDEAFAVMLALNTEKIIHIRNEAHDVYRRTHANREAMTDFIETHPGFGVLRHEDGGLTMTYFGKEIFIDVDDNP